MQMPRLGLHMYPPRSRPTVAGTCSWRPSHGFAIIELLLVLIILSILVFASVPKKKEGQDAAVIIEKSKVRMDVANVRILQDAYDRIKLMKPEVINIPDNSISMLISVLVAEHACSTMDVAHFSVKAGTFIDKGNAEFEIIEN